MHSDKKENYQFMTSGDMDIDYDEFTVELR